MEVLSKEKNDNFLKLSLLELGDVRCWLEETFGDFGDLCKIWQRFLFRHNTLFCSPGSLKL